MNTRLQYLFDRFLEKSCTPGERQELMGLALEEGLQTELQELIAAAADRTGNDLDMDQERSDSLFHSIVGKENVETMPPVRHMHFQKLRWWAAAAIIILVGIGSYFMFFNRNKKETEIVRQEPAKDIKAPVINRAMITLDDGRTVYLDSANNGELAMQGNMKLVKLANGQIAYETTTGEVLREMKYNTLSNPRGSKVIDMALADGSHVWLNAGSTITYPVAFVGNERNVTITGEAYFEVTSDKLKPFKVSKGDMAIEVLGTHFNVNAYDDEDDIKVTLLEGSVKVSNDHRSLIIKPSEQAIVTGNDVTLNKQVDMEVVMAWKNGRFEFGGGDIEKVMRNISRWYDVEVIYEVKPGDSHLRGGISRDVEVSKVLKIIEATEAVHFRIEGKKVFVIK